MWSPKGVSVQDLLKIYGWRSIIMAVADNMGYKRKGGYMQTAVHALLVIPWESIVEIGAHREELWIRPERDVVVQADEFTMGFDAEGEATLVERRKLAWDEAVELWKCTCTTDNDEGRSDTAVNDLDETTHPDVRRDNGGTVTLGGRVLGPTGDESINQLEANKTAMQEVRLEDFSNTEALIKLAECWKEQVDFLKNMPQVDDEVKQGEIRRLIDKMKVQVLTDGKPAVQFSDAKNRGDAPVLDEYEFFAGAFHKAKELYMLTGKQHRMTVLHPLLHAVGRMTDGRKKWVEEPGDPNDCAKLFREFAYALRVAIVGEFVASGRDISDATASNLEAYMLERASVCPAAMVTLLWLRDLEVIHWLEDTERDTDCERGFKEYRQVLPLMQRIHVVNHGATNYTSMVAREILRWKTESPAMIKVFGSFCYTVWTAGGKRQWGDRFVENMVRAGRCLLGRVWTQSHASKVKGVFANLSSIMQARIGALGDAIKTNPDVGQEGGGSSKKKMATSRKVVVSKQFVRAQRFFEETKIFASGDGDIVPFKCTGGEHAWASGRGGKQLPRGAYVGLDGALLNKDYFSVNELADMRAQKYADAAVAGDYKFKCDISDIQAVAKIVRISALKEWQKEFSSEPAVIAAQMTKDSIYNHLLMLKGLNVECLQGQGALPKKSANKQQLVQVLATARRAYHASVAPPAQPQQEAADADFDQLGDGEKLCMAHWQMQNLL
jgi:hypothetical protein